MDNFTQISVEKAHAIIKSGETTVVDIRDADAFAQGHIAHAKNINDKNINGFLQETDKTLPLICYCYHGISSQKAAVFLAGKGFKQVYSLEGGWEKWKESYG